MRWKRSNIRSRCSSGIPTPVSRTRNSTTPSTGFNVSSTSPSNVNFKALERRFRTIFSHMSRSTYTGSASGWHATENRRPPLSIERAGYFRCEGGQVSGLIGRLHASGFHARKIQEGIDELEQSEPVAPHRNQLFVMFGTQPLACCRQHFLKGAEHQRQRRSELVTDVAEKRRLGAIELGQRLCPLAFLLVGAGAGQPDGDLFCNPIDELVRIVKSPAGMDSRDKETQRFAVFSQPDRHHACFLGRGRPIGHRHARSA